jgi:hypothetical protein
VDIPKTIPYKCAVGYEKLRAPYAPGKLDIYVTQNKGLCNSVIAPNTKFPKEAAWFPETTIHSHPVFITLSCQFYRKCWLVPCISHVLMEMAYYSVWFIISHAGLVLDILVSLTDFGDVSRLADLLNLAYG